MINKYSNKIKNVFESGLLNKYMVSRVSDAASDGLTDDLYDDLVKDAISASSVGVENNRDYGIYFYVSLLADDILSDTFDKSITPDEKTELCRFVLRHKDDNRYKLDNLTDYRILIHKWLTENFTKKAHPNIAGKNTKEITYQTDKWIEALKHIYSLIHSNGMSRKDSFNYITSSWDSDERIKFDNWMKYYESGTTEKYSVKTAKFIQNAQEPTPILPEALFSRQTKSLPVSTFRNTLEPTKKELDAEMAKKFKSQMRSRLLSFRKMLEGYHDILPKQSIDQIYDELFALEKSVGKLNVFASLQDRMILSANRIRSFGFSEGAEVLKKFAADPSVMQSIPTPESKEPNLLEQSGPMVNVQSIINRLEGIGKTLKSRDMIRELASIDILLNEMGMASYFPELSDSQAKLIEAFGYASNKVEAIIAKLRGSGTSKPKNKEEKTEPAPIPQPPPLAAPAAPSKPEATSKSAPPQKPIETGEIMTKPMGKIEEKIPTK